jgi:hypothetical protein
VVVVVVEVGVVVVEVEVAVDDVVGDVEGVVVVEVLLIKNEADKAATRARATPAKIILNRK